MADRKAELAADQAKLDQLWAEYSKVAAQSDQERKDAEKARGVLDGKSDPDKKADASVKLNELKDQQATTTKRLTWLQDQISAVMADQSKIKASADQETKVSTTKSLDDLDQAIQDLAKREKERETALVEVKGQIKDLGQTCYSGSILVSVVVIIAIALQAFTDRFMR